MPDTQTTTTAGTAPATSDVLTEAPVTDAKATVLLTPERAVRLRACPIRLEGGSLLLAMLEPGDFEAADEVSVVTGRPVIPVGIAAEPFEELMRRCYGTTAAAMAARLGGGAQEEDLLTSNLEAVEADDLHRMAEQPSLINLVNLILLEAIRARASDVHVEPFEKELKVKYRIDGVLKEQSPPPKQLQPAITSRIKIMSGMNIAERYVPQDGHITLRYEGRKIDLRVSTVPTLYGESVVMRILDKESIRLDLKSLGLREQDRTEIARVINVPHGMFLVTGPTGSGKTTTLYTCLSMVTDSTKKIITIEDPVEYELGGVNQIPVNPKRGLSFATGLRSILRQDPDIVMVGEIRDGETAEIAVRAALTGHMIFSTLHTNNAAAAPGRMLDMGIEPFLLASVIEGVLGQRLGRRICPHCTMQVPVPAEAKVRLGESEMAMFVGGMAYKGAGCEKCEGTGYSRRVAFCELFTANPAFRAGIGKRLPSHELAKAAPEGFVTMRRDGLIKAAAGMTTLSEVFRATQDTDEGAE
jgi:type II secretory ATPase GspE/PulE/Tfp pilus assembly ATPase PilB-like protein